MTLDLVHPTVHLNGTSRAALAEGYEAAGTALRGALEALGNCAPNGRDYYPQKPGALQEAQVQHDRRTAAVRGVLAEIETLFEVLVEAA